MYFAQTVYHQSQSLQNNLNSTKNLGKKKTSKLRNNAKKIVHDYCITERRQGKTRQKL